MHSCKSFFQLEKREYLIHSRSDKAEKGIEFQIKNTTVGM